MKPRKPTEKKVITKAQMVSYFAEKEVKPLGDGGYVLLPKMLIGKIVKVTYRK